MNLVDTHCHLNFRDAFPDVAATLHRAKENRVEAVVVVGCDTDTSRYAVELADAHDPVYAVVGWHPNSSAQYSTTEREAIRALCDNPKVVAVGEIGLDYYRDYATKEEQRECLNDFADLAREKNLPVVFHCRDAHDDLLDWYESLDDPPRGVLHCFSGTQEHAVRANSLGLYFGVDGPITYKNADTLRSIVVGLPRDRVLIETDAPYLSPHPFRGKPNEPGMVRFVNDALAAVWGVSAEEAAAITTKNAADFFGLRL